MLNILGAAADTIKSMITQDDNQPLHLGEAYNCWIYLAGLQLSKVSVQIALNTTKDAQLTSILNEDLQLNNDQQKKLHDFMISEGVTLPPGHEDLPKSDAGSIPLGVMMTDEVIANDLSIKIASLIMMAAGGSTQAIRNDVGAMFAQFLSVKLLLGSRLKLLMRERGWIKVPPFFAPPGAMTLPPQ